jgi:hypothetical protein
MRKPFIKEGLIPTILNIGIKTAQKKSRKSGSQGKTGRKTQTFITRRNCLNPAEPDD